MNKAKFTSGEWFADKPDSSNGWWDVNSDANGEVAVCYDAETAKFDAHLIAAAPKMYEMLDEIYTSACMTGETSETLEDIKQLLAQARGEK